jgi:predicted small secreted protein
MKKFIYTIAMLFVLAFTIASCQEENVKPAGGDGPAGGGVIDPLR